MAVFFRSASVSDVATERLETALATDPESVTNRAVEAAKIAAEIGRETKGTFSWGRLALAVVLLLGLLFATIYTGQQDKLVELYKVQLHAFEVLLGVVVGLLGGEAVNR